MNGCVYVIHALTTNYYKIGITADEIKKRLNGLQSSHPFWDLEIVTVHYCNAYKMLEKTLHKKYANQRLRNSEWFSLTDKELMELKMDTYNLLERVGVIEDTDEPSPETVEAELPAWKKRSTTLHDLFPSQTIEDEPIVENDEAEDEAKNRNGKIGRGCLLLKEKIQQELKDNTYEQVAETYDVNKGIIWKVANTDYEPLDEEIRLAFGLPERIIIDVVRDEKGRFS